MFRNCLLLILMFLPSAGWCEAWVNVHLVYVAQDDGKWFTPNLDAVFGNISTLSVNLRLRRVTYQSIDPTNYGSIDDGDITEQVNGEAFRYWRSEARSNGWFHGVDIVHVVLPPFEMLETGLRYIAGRSEICGKFSVARTAPTVRGKSECIIEHEIGHTLGARHDDGSGNIMSSNTSVFVPRDAVTCPLGFEAAAVKQVRKCMVRKRWMGKRRSNL